MNIREATAGIRRGHLEAEDFSLLRNIIGAVTSSSPEEVVGRINGSARVGQALIYDLAFGSRDEMSRIRESLGNQRLTDLCVAIRQHIERPTTCRCGQTIPYGVYTCSSCGATIAPVRSRRPDARPTQELVATVASGQTRIGFPYLVRKNRDGSLSCNCLGFMNQTHLQPVDRGYAICRHMQNIQTEFAEFREPSEFQKAMLRSLGITSHTTLTNDQAYFLIHDVLDQQGIDFAEYVGLVRQHGKAEGLPIWTVGWEFEGGLQNRSSVSSIMPAGWNIGSDSSVRPARGYASVEIRSPKLFGKEAFAQMETVLNACVQAGWNNTNSAGMHTHVNASMSTPEQRVALAKAWHWSRNAFIQWLVPNHRRHNHFCQALSARDIRDIESLGAPSGGRYRDLNFCAFSAHRSIEVRLHQCSADAAEVKNWTIFLLKFFEAAMIKGVAPERFRETAQGGDINAFLSLIGMDGTAVTPVRVAADKIRERFAQYRAEGAGSFVAEEDDDDEYVEPVPLTPEQQFWTAVSMVYNSTFRTEGAPGGNRVNNLLRRGVSTREPFSSVSGITANTTTPGAIERLATHRWSFRSETLSHEVAWNSNTDELTCSCGYFGEHGFCRYSVAVARYLNAIRRQNSTRDALTGEILALSGAVIQSELPVIEPEPVPAETAAQPEVQPVRVEPLTVDEEQLQREAAVEVEAEIAANAETPGVANIRRIYETYDWHNNRDRADTFVPVSVWREAGSRIGRLTPFDSVVEAYNRQMTSNDVHFLVEIQTVQCGQTPIRIMAPRETASLSSYGRCLLRYQLAVQMGTGLIPRTRTTPVLVEEAPEAAAEAPEAEGGDNVMDEARRLYENYDWRANRFRDDTFVPVSVWDAAAKRVGRMVPFDSVVEAYNDAMNTNGNGHPELDLVSLLHGNNRVNTLVPIESDMGFRSRCLLRYQLAVLMAQGSIPRRRPRRRSA